MGKIQNIEQIIHCATQHFALQGYAETSLRQIVEEAGVGLGTINFYFQTKEELFLAVIQRVINEINRERREILEEARIGGMNIERVLEAIMWPLISRMVSDDPAERRMSYLLRWATLGPGPVEQAVRKMFDPICAELIEAIMEAVPGLRRSDAVWGMSVAVSMLYSRQVLDQRYEHLMPLPTKERDLAWAKDCTRRLTGIIAGGLLSVADGEHQVLTGPSHTSVSGRRALSRS